ncbi:MAG: putative manganese-dependent inorganic diphosphatase [Oscillospiraceae bacterium]|nr:putative manganese-dependent inorganic diphosphatase [Oscillospiraceae bacterium]
MGEIMDPIYVTGHRNPDTDSIVSAIAYAALRNSLGDRNYIAARLGNVSDETNAILKKFNVEPPMLLSNVRTQVRDLNYDTPPALHHSVPVSRAWDTLTNSGSITVLPVIDSDGKLYGMLTSGDIASYTMRAVSDPYINNVPIYNLLSVLEGEIINQIQTIPEELSGEVVIAMPQARESLVFSSPDSIVICGQQEDMIQHAIDIGVKAVIVCQADVEEEYRMLESKTLIITTPLDAYRAARLIHLAVPIDRLCTKENLIYFKLTDYIDDVREVLLKNRFRAYPIVDENEQVVGTLGRFHLIKPKRKKVFLVDHNESSQSVPGLNQAEVVGIIDHHRLGDIQTKTPINFTCEPLGSTATIIATMYQQKGLMPSRRIAGLLCSAIISDTVMFKSPTCTETDKIIAARMARIANVTLEEVGDTVFSSVASDRPIEEQIFTDFKEFLIAGHKLGVGQVTALSSDKLVAQKDTILKAMEGRKKERGYDYILIMLTDVLKEGTELFYIGDDETISNAYGVEAHDNECFLPHVMSRKKQIIPRLSEMWG